MQKLQEDSIEVHKEITRLLGKEGAKHWDADFRIMSLKDLIQKIKEGNITNGGRIDEIITTLIAQLDDINVVRSNAIKLIIELNNNNNLNDGQIKTILESLMNIVLSAKYGSDKAKILKEITGCIKNLIAHQEKVNYTLLQANVVNKCFEFINIQKAEKQTKDILQEIIEIMIQIIQKNIGAIFKISNQEEINKYESLFQKLLEIIVQKNLQFDEYLARCAIQCLGSCSMVVSQNTINQTITNIFLHKLKNLHFEFDRLQIEITEYAIIKLSEISSSKFTNDTINQLEKYAILQKAKSENFIQEDEEKFEDDQSHLQFIVKTLCNNINIFQQIILHQDKFQLSPQLQQFLVDLISFDPQKFVIIQKTESENLEIQQSQSMEIEDNNDEEGDQEGEDTQNESWKVRYAAIRVFETILQSKPGKETIQIIYEYLIQDKNENVAIVRRITENNNDIRIQTISLFSNFLSTISKTDKDALKQFDETGFLTSLQLIRINSQYKQLNLNDLVIKIVKQVKLVLNDKKTSEKVKLKSFQLVQELCKNANKVIICNKQTLKILTDFLFYIIQNENKTFQSMLIIHALSSFKRLIRIGKIENQSENHFYPYITQLGNLHLQDKNNDIANESLKLLSSLFIFSSLHFSQQADDLIQKFSQCIPSITQRLQIPESKQLTIQCIGTLVLKFGNQLSDQNIKNLYELLLLVISKEKNTYFQILALRIIKLMPFNAFKINKNNQDKAAISLLNDSLFQFDKLLKYQDKNLQVAALDSINSIIVILSDDERNSISLSVGKQLSNSLFSLFDEPDIQQISISLKILKNIVRQMVKLQGKEYDDLILKILNQCIYLSQNRLIQDKQLDRFYKIFYIISNSNKYNNKKILQMIIDKLNQDSQNAIARAVATVFLECDQKLQGEHLQNFSNIISKQGNNTNEIELNFVLKALGHIGNKYNLLNHQQIFQGILDLIKNRNQKLEIRQLACISLGEISLGNLEKSLTIIINLATNDEDLSYFLLFTLYKIFDKILLQKQTNPQSQQVTFMISKQSEIIQFLTNRTNHKEYSEKQNYHKITAQCLGLLAGLNLQNAYSYYQQNFQSQNPATRKTFIISYNFFIIIKSESDNIIKQFVSLLIQQMNDPDVQCRKDVYEAIEKVCTLKYYVLELIDENYKQDFFSSIKRDIEINQTLISKIKISEKEQDLQKIIDKGLNLRIQAHKVIEILSESKFMEIHIKDIIVTLVSELVKEHDQENYINKLQILKNFAQVNPRDFINQIQTLNESLFSNLKGLLPKFKTISYDSKEQKIVNLNLTIWKLLSQLAKTINCQTFLINEEKIHKQLEFKVILDEIKI